MGWEITKVGSNITTKQYVQHYIKNLSDGVLETVKISEGKNIDGQKAFYVAFRKIEDNSVFAVVFLTKRKNGFISLKVINETSGPLDTEAPASLIYLLTPTESAYAIQWRADCINQYIATKVLKGVA